MNSDELGKTSVGHKKILVLLSCILVVALVLRIGAAVAVQRIVSQTPGRLCLIAGDAEGYWELGRQIARGKNFEIYDPPRRVLRMPGFPVVLAVSMALFGEDVGRARFVLALIGTLACGSVFWLARDLFGPEVGLIAAGLAAISPTFIVFSVMILSETTFALTLMLSLIGLVHVIRAFRKDEPGSNPSRSTLKKALFGGLAAALACYIRPSWLLFPPAVMALLWIYPNGIRTMTQTETLSFSGGRRRFNVFLLTFTLLAGLGLGLTPWTVRNYWVTEGKFVPTTLWMGPSLYDGLNPDANGDSHMEFLPNSVYESMSEYEVDRHYRRAAWKWAAENPSKVCQLAWVKLGRYWNLFPNTPQFDYWYVRLGLLAFVMPVLGFAIWALFKGHRWRRSDLVSWGWILVLTLGPILYFSGLHTLFVSSLRYRLPAEYSLLALSAAGIWDCYKRWGN